ncbi:glycosyltransferase [Nocardioides insulae]|uniref:glycosyltransferase n=1 Tax=Nocardioides insulae TaxID=394734 RepID=UPI000688B2D9|nr:glycosyltransferase [Nocardioides insulae]
MRYLLAIWDGGGATPPNLGVARMLVARGHEVVVYGDATLAADVGATGAVHRPWPTAPQRVSTSLDDDVLKDWECRTPIGAFLRARDRLVAGPAGLFAADVVAALDAQHFDAVLADGVLLGALVGAEARGVPAAVLHGTVYLVPSPARPPLGRIAPARGPLGHLRDRAGCLATNLLWRSGVRSLNAARATHGLAPLRHLWDQWGHAERVLMLTASAFDDPPANEPNVRYVGPVLEDLRSEAEVPLPPGDDPLVVVGLSSSYMAQSEVLRQFAQALASLSVRAVITTGPAIDPAEVPSAPNVVVVQTAMHGSLIPRADLVVTHAGHGTLMKALAAGVPMLCVPFGRDQPDNAARAVRHGVAHVVSKRSDAAAFSAAVRTALDDPVIRTGAAALGARVRAEIDSGQLLAELEALPGRRRPAPEPA